MDHGHRHKKLTQDEFEKASDREQRNEMYRSLGHLEAVVTPMAIKVEKHETWMNKAIGMMAVIAGVCTFLGVMITHFLLK